jgi:hypothetical protein
VRDQQDRDTPVPDPLDQVPGVAPRVPVEPGGQLVEDRDLGVADQGERDREPLLLAARELPEAGVALLLEAEVGQQRMPVGGVVVEGGVEVERLPHLHLLGKLALLELRPDVLPELGAVPDRVEPEHRHLAGVGGPETLDDLDGGVLPAPLGPRIP